MIVSRSIQFLLVATFFLATWSQAYALERHEHPHYFHLRQGVTFYIPNPEGKEFTFQVDVKDLNVFCQGAQTALIKAYDPDGKILFREDVADDGITSGGYQQARAGWDHELWAYGGLRESGAEPLFRWDAFSEPAKLDKLRGEVRQIKVPAGKPGVYQVMVVGCDDHFVKVATSPMVKFGVQGHPDFVAGHGEQFREAYVYLPELPDYASSRKHLDVWLLEHAYPRTRKISVSMGSHVLPLVNVVDESSTAEAAAGQAFGRYRLPTENLKAGGVLKITNRGTGDFLLRIHGVPAILCPDPETAKQIGGDLRKSADGMITTFPFQSELWEAVRHLQKKDFVVEPGAGKWLDTSGAELAKFKLHVWGRSGTPASVDKTLQSVSALLAKSEPFDMRSFYRQVSVGSINDLTLFYLYPFQGNKLYHNEALRNLITIGLIKQWMKYRAGEVIYEPYELNVAYAQGFHWDYWEPIWNMKEQLDPAVLKAFQKGVARIAERMFYANGLELVISNGRSTVPLNIYHAYLITGDERLKKLALRHFHRMYSALDGPHSGWSKTGYFREHFAADGGYCTYVLYQLGRMYQLSGDPEVLECLDRLSKWICYSTMPNGKRWIGPTSWNGRTHVSAIEHIWGNGYKFIAQKSPWAAMIYRRMQPAGAYDFAEPVYSAAKPPEKPTLLLTHLTRNVLPDRTLPAESKGSFLEDVNEGGELFAIRRGNYYALVFAGSRPPFWQDTALGGVMAQNGGGLTALYVQGHAAAGAGPVLLGRQAKDYGYPIESWASNPVPVVAGQITDGRFFSTGVSRNQVNVDKKNWKIETTGEAISAPVNYRRSYTFGEKAISAEIEVRNADLHHEVFQYRKHFRKPHLSIRYAWELVPVMKHKERKITCLDSQGKVLGSAMETPTDGVSLVRIEGPGGGAEIRLAEPTSVKISPTKAPSQALQILVTENLAPDAIAVLKYTITPVQK